MKTIFVVISIPSPLDLEKWVKIVGASPGLDLGESISTYFWPIDRYQPMGSLRLTRLFKVGLGKY